MKTRSIYLCLLLLVLGTANVWADKYYRPTERVSTLEPGEKYMIFNTCINGNASTIGNSEDRSGFLYNSGTGLGMNETKKKDAHIYNECHLFTLSEADDADVDYDYFVKSLSSGTYVGLGSTNNESGVKLNILEWTTAKAHDTFKNKLAGVGSVAEDDVTFVASADISTGDKVFLVTTSGGGNDCWNANPATYASWSTGHPYAFYKVEEVTPTQYDRIQELHVFSRCDIYSAQKIYGYVQDASKISSNHEFEGEGAKSNLIDGNLNTYNVTNWHHNIEGEYHYYQLDLGVRISDLRLYMSRRANATNAPIKVQLSACNEENGEFVNIGEPFETGLATNTNYASGVLSLGESYRYIRLTAIERYTSNFTCMALSELYVLPGSGRAGEIITNSLNYFDNTLPVSATTETYNTILDSYPSDVKLLSGVPMPGNRYRIYADAYSGGAWVNRDISTDGTYLLANGSFDASNDAYVWECQDRGNGLMAFYNEAQNVYLANGTVISEVYEWSINTNGTNRHGVPLIDNASGYLAVANSGDGFAAPDATTSPLDQTAGDYCTDFVFLPIALAEGEKQVTVNNPSYGIYMYQQYGSLKIGENVIQGSHVAIYNKESALPVASVTEGFDYYVFEGFFNGETNLGPTLEFDNLSDGMVLEARFAIKKPFDYTTEADEVPTFYYIRNMRAKDDEGTGYATYRGVISQMTQCNAQSLSINNLFYFTGEATPDAYVAKIHNAATPLLCSNYNVWNAEGVDYYIQPNNRATENRDGYAIAKTQISSSAQNPTDAWADYGGSGTVVRNDQVNDDGATWDFEKVDADVAAGLIESYATAQKATVLSQLEALKSNNAYDSEVLTNEIARINAITPSTTAEWLALAQELGVTYENVASLARVFPTLTTDVNNPVWYYVKNIRDTAIPYATYQGDAVEMIETGAPTSKTLFYFTGEESVTSLGTKALKVKIHNFSTANVMAAINNWTEQGTYYYIYHRTGTNPGFIISTAPDFYTSGWSDHGGTNSNAIKDYLPGDDGSTWVFEEVTDFKTPLADYIAGIKTAEAGELDALKSSDEYYDSIIDDYKTYVNGLATSEVTYVAQLSLKNKIEAVSSIVTNSVFKLPRLSTGSEKYYYRIENRKSENKFIGYEGDTETISLTTEERAKQLFYFTGEKTTCVNGLPALRVKVNNILNDNKLADGSQLYFDNLSQTGAGVEGQSVGIGQTLSGAGRWVINLAVQRTTTDASFNNYGTALLATDHAALNSTFDNGFQIYLEKDGDMLLRQGDVRTYFEPTNKNWNTCKFVLAYGRNNFTVRADFDGAEIVEKTITHMQTLNDITELYTALPAGINITNLKAYSIASALSWTVDGNYMYIAHTENNDNPGLGIITGDANPANLGLNNNGGYGETVAMYSANDGGSHWSFTEVTSYVAYEVNERNAEKVAFNSAVEAKPILYAPATVTYINGEYDALNVEGDDMASLADCLTALATIRAKWEISSDLLPELTTDEQLPVWYAIKNVRSGKYATYAGDEVKLTQGVAPSNGSLFYFTGENNGGPLKIHNFMTDKLSETNNKWSVEGKDYYFVKYDHETNPGYVISNKATLNDNNTAWNDEGQSTVTNYGAQDAGSTWLFEKVYNFEPVFALNKRIEENLASLDCIANNPSAFYVANTEDQTDLKNNLEALRATYADGTYANCSIADATLKTYEEALNALYTQTKLMYFKSKLGDYWLGTNATILNATNYEPVHTNVWNAQYVGSGKYYIYNEAANKYVGRCANSNGSTLGVVPNVANAGLYTFVLQSDGSYIIESADVKGAYLKLNVANLLTVTTTADATLDAVKWEITRTPIEKILISDELYAKAASLVWTEMASINSEHGLVHQANMITSNYPAVDASGNPNDGTGYPALIDGVNSTYFHSAYDAAHGGVPSANSPHYLQFDLGEGHEVSSLYLYMLARNQNNRPTKIKVEVSNTGNDGDWTLINGELPTDLNHQTMFLSGLIGDESEGATKYRYWRFTVIETNTRTIFFSLAEFMLFKNEDYVKSFFEGANRFYNTHFELLDIVKGAIQYLSSEAVNYIQRKEAGLDIATPYEEQKIGYYNIVKYEAMKNAYDYCNGLLNQGDVTAEALELAWKELEEAVAVYTDSRNCPVFYVYNAYEDGFSNKLAVSYTGTEFDTKELSKWDYTQMFYALHLMSSDFMRINPDDPESESPFERHLISYNGRKNIYNSNFVEFTAIKDWRSVNGYEGEENTAFNIDVNTSSSGNDYLTVTSVGLYLRTGNSSEIDETTQQYNNRQSAWYITYICEKKHLDEVGEITLESMNRLYMAYNMLKVRQERIGPDFNQYTWVGDNVEAFENDMHIAELILSSSMKEVADALQSGVISGDISFNHDYLNSLSTTLNSYLDCFEMNMPKTGRYYRFSGMTNRGVAQDYYITSEAVQHSTGGAGNQYTISMKPLYTDEATYAQNEETTIYYFGEFDGLTYNPGWLTDNTPKSYLMAYKTGRYLGVGCGYRPTESEYNNWTGLRDNWNFEIIHQDKAKVVPVNFSKSVTAYSSPAYAIKSGTHFLYAGNDYVDRSIDPRQAAAGDYWKHDWAIELVEELPVTIGETLMSSYYVPVELQIPEGITAYILYADKVTTENSDMNVVTEQAHEAGYDVFCLMAIKGGILPAATPVLLKAKEAKTYHFKINYEPTITSEEAKRATYTYKEGFEDIDNLLKGTHETDFIEEVDNATHYVLANKQSRGVAMYKMTMKNLGNYTSYNYTHNYTGTFAKKVFLNSAHRAYLPFSTTSQPASAYLFSVRKDMFEGTTGIDGVVNEELNGSKFKGDVYDIQGRKVEKITEPGMYIVNGQTILVK